MRAKATPVRLTVQWLLVNPVQSVLNRTITRGAAEKVTKYENEILR